MVTISKQPIFISIPTDQFLPKKQIIIGATDVSNDVTSFEAEPGISENISSALITIDNRNGKYTSDFAKYSIVKIYADYTNPTTKVFEGRLYVPEYVMDDNGYSLTLDCRGYGYDALRRKVSYEPETASAISTIFKYLITTYLTPYGHSVDFSNIATISTQYKPTWSRKTPHECMQDLIDAAGGDYDYRCDNDKVWHLYQKGTKNSSFAIIVKENMKNIRVIDGDLTSMSNKLTVYGKEADNIPRMKTFNNAASQTLYGIFEDDDEDSNLTIDSQLTLKGTAKLSQLVSMEQKGTCLSIGIPGLIPGYNAYIFNPNCNVMGLKRIVSVKQLYSSNGFFTDSTFEQKEKGTVYHMQQRLLKEKVLGKKGKWGMKNSKIISFINADYGSNLQTPNSNAELETMNNTVIWDNHLQLELNNDSGYCITKEFILETVASSFVVTLSGQNLVSDENENWNDIFVEIADGDIGFQEVTRDTVITPTTPGTKIRIRINMSSLTSKIKHIGFLWNG